MKSGPFRPGEKRPGLAPNQRRFKTPQVRLIIALALAGEVGGDRKWKAGVGRGRGAGVGRQALGGGPGRRGESPECWAEAIIGLQEEPPPLSRLSPPPPVPPLPKPRKAVQVSSSAFAFPSRCPLQTPRAALRPPARSDHGHTEGPS